MAINAKASANTKAMIIAVKILGAAEGFRPSEIMLAKALAANTAQGLIMHKVKIIVSFLDSWINTIGGCHGW